MSIPAPAPVSPLPLDTSAPPPSAATVEQAYAVCAQIAGRHGENFPVASLLTPPRLRRHVQAIYAFARTADDFADEPAFEGRRGQLLDAYDDELERAFRGEASQPIFIALADTAERFELPIAPFQDLLSAFRADLTRRRYATFAELRGLLTLVAEPIGRLLLNLFGYRSPALLRYGDDLSAGLALANFWQDVGKDLARDRIYLPSEDLRHFGVTEDDLRDRLAGRPPRTGSAKDMTQRIRDLMRFEVSRARAILDRGRPLIEAVGPDVGVEIAAFWLGGQRILDKIEAGRHDVLTRRPRTNGFDLLAVGAGALWWRARARLAGRGAARPSFERSGG